MIILSSRNRIHIQRERKSFKNKTPIIDTLIQLGAHIGDTINYKHFDHNIFINILCIRNNIYVFDLTKTIIYLRRAINFICKVARNGGRLLFYHSNIDCYYMKYIYYHLIRTKTSNSFIGIKFKGGYISNYKHCFLKFVNLLSNIPMRSRVKRYMTKTPNPIVSKSFRKYKRFYERYLFLKLLSIMKAKSFLTRDWLVESRKLLPYWKSFVFLRSFLSVFEIPECLIAVNPSNDWNVLSEYSRSKKLPSIGVIDTSSLSSNCTYAIPSNDDSIPLSLFYTSIFLNTWSTSFIGHFLKNVNKKPLGYKLGAYNVEQHIIGNNMLERQSTGPDNTKLTYIIPPNNH